MYVEEILGILLQPPVWSYVQDVRYADGYKQEVLYADNRTMRRSRYGLMSMWNPNSDPKLLPTLEGSKSRDSRQKGFLTD